MLTGPGLFCRLPKIPVCLSVHKCKITRKGQELPGVKHSCSSWNSEIVVELKSRKLNRSGLAARSIVRGIGCRAKIYLSLYQSDGQTTKEVGKDVRTCVQRGINSFVSVFWGIHPTNTNKEKFGSFFSALWLMK